MILIMSMHVVGPVPTLFTGASVLNLVVYSPERFSTK
eukprot:SAG11_NODE_15489_length_576_cov_1.209644_2_plen_36_part_01